MDQDMYGLLCLRRDTKEDLDEIRVKYPVLCNGKLRMQDMVQDNFNKNEAPQR